jgi:multidrug resistance efflux pump
VETTALKGWIEGVSAKLPEKQWRRLAGGGLAGLIVITGGSVLLRKRSIEAYTTADVVSVYSPIQGVVKQQNLTAGEQFSAGEMLLDIEASRNDASKLASTTLKLRQTEAELNAVTQELQRYKQINVARLESEVDRAERTLQDLEAQQRRYASQANRYRDLVKTGAMDEDTLIGSETMATSLAQRVGNQRQDLENLRLEFQSARSGIKTLMETPWRSARRMEIMEVELNRLASRRKELLDQRDQLQQEVAAAQKRSTFVYRPQFPGMILTSRTSVGDEVNDGNLLLTAVNCNKLRVEALFEASKLKDLRLGQDVRIEWPLSGRSSTGQIVSLRGPPVSGKLSPL